MTDTSLDSKIQVLDKGYVRLIDKLGDDTNLVNAARASFRKEISEMGPKDKGLLKYLVNKTELSPFRHAFLSFEIYAPLMTARQWFKYSIGSNHGEAILGWSEASLRYLTLEPEFYIPQKNEWRSSPENKKQGSDVPISEDKGSVVTLLMEQQVEDSIRRYEYALKMGVAQELARGFLPSNFMYTCWRWSTSVQAVMFFLGERLKGGAQHEITQYAKAIKELVAPHFPHTMELLLEDNT